MARRLLLILLALVLVLPVACATNQVEAPEQPLQVYSTEMENQGFSNALTEVDALLAECKEKAMRDCPDMYDKAVDLRNQAYAAWVDCRSEDAWNLIRQALAAAKNACACEQVAVVEEAAPVVLSWEHALFDFDKSNIRPDAAAVLDGIAEDLVLHPETKVIIIGHTDSIGTEDYNDALSKRRSDSAVRYLIEKGVDQSQIHSIKAKGELFPAFPNLVDGRDNPANRQKNRRVEIIQYK